jgi:hypothetical protein
MHPDAFPWIDRSLKKLKGEVGGCEKRRERFLKEKGVEILGRTGFKLDNKCVGDLRLTKNLDLLKQKPILTLENEDYPVQTKLKTPF